MDRHQHHHEGSGFFNGFLLGAIIGAAVVFFLFTDKGKKLFKTITEEGLEGFEEFKTLIDEEMEEEDEPYEDMVDAEPHLAPIPHKTAHSHVEPIHEHHDHYHEDHHQEHPEDHVHREPAPTPSRVKRFFKGVKR